MLKNYLKIALRNLMRHKVFSLINIAGLAVGMAAGIIILRYIYFEMNYEGFNKNSKDVYRVQVDRYQNGTLQFKSARSYPGLSKIITDEIPEVTLSTRAYPEECLFKYGEKKISNQAVLWVDDPFVKIFDLKMIKASSNEPLKNTFSSVISLSAAKRFFGNEDPIGKTIILNEGVSFIVNGVFEDYPSDSHMKFDFLLSMNTIGALDGYDIINTIYYNWLYTYIQVRPGCDPHATEQKLQQLVKKHFVYLNDSNSKIDLLLQPLKDIHLKSDLSEEMFPNGNIRTVWYLLLIAVIILVMAWINFINLSTARALERAKEVGMRKVVGAGRPQIIKQFIMESAFINTIAFIFSVFLVELLIPVIRQIIDRNIEFSIFAAPGFWISVFLIFLLSGVAAGIYPALLLSSFNPAVIIKGKFRNSSKGSFIRKSLIVFQFTAAVALIICTIVITKQLEFVRSQYLGFNTDQVLVINSPRSLIKNEKRIPMFERFKETLLNYPSVKNVSASDVIPGKEIVTHLENFAKLGSESQNISFSGQNVDRDFFRLLDIRFLSGRGFSKEFGMDSASIVINRSASKMLGFNSPEDAVNNYVADLNNGHKLKVIGVVADYHHENFKRSIEPIIYFQGHNYQFGYFPVKLNTKNIAETIGFINGVWTNIYPDDPFDYFFLDEFFNAQYKADVQFGRTIVVFSMLAIIIAALGLFGLSTLVAVQRTKEIGIRKALGASTPGLLYELSKDFLILIAISNAVAWPVIYFVMRQWLDGFILRIGLNILYFIIPGLAVIAGAFAIMSLQTLKVAKANPVESLKYE